MLKQTNGETDEQAIAATLQAHIFLSENRQKLYAQGMQQATENKDHFFVSLPATISVWHLY
jgi:hypothetical protein